jgi:hypothetical protein
VQVNRKLGEEESAEFLQTEINKRCKALYGFLVKYLELEKEQPDWQTVVPRILG